MSWFDDEDDRWIDYGHQPGAAPTSVMVIDNEPSRFGANLYEEVPPAAFAPATIAARVDFLDASQAHAHPPPLAVWKRERYAIDEPVPIQYQTLRDLVSTGLVFAWFERRDFMSGAGGAIPAIQRDSHTAERQTRWPTESLDSSQEDAEEESFAGGRIMNDDGIDLLMERGAQVEAEGMGFLTATAISLETLVSSGVAGLLPRFSRGPPLRDYETEDPALSDDPD